MFYWSKRQRRKRLLVEPISAAWMHYLDANVWQYRYLSDPQRARLNDTARIIAAEREWIGCGGLEMTDEIRLTVAGQAALLLIGFEPGYYFDGLRSVLVYPSTYVQPPEFQRGWLVNEEGYAMYGEAWHRGPVVLSWDNVVAGGRGPNEGQNLVLHELAHFVDGLNGDVDGVPPLGTRAEYHRWFQVAGPEFTQLVQHVARGRPTLLDEYGATNEAEFFAVATEMFFQCPLELRREHTELYSILQSLYRWDIGSRLDASQ